MRIVPAILSRMDNYWGELDSLFHALADPTRRAVVQRLGQGPLTVSDLARPFDMALPSFMKHLAVLETAGLIKTNKVSRTRTCTLEQEKLAALEKWFSQQRAIWEERYKNLDDLLSSLDGEQNEQ